MLTTTRRRALVAAAGLTAALAPILAAAPASADPTPDSGSPGILAGQGSVGCGQQGVKFDAEGAEAFVSASCDGGNLWLGGMICDTKKDGKSAFIEAMWPDGWSVKTHDSDADNSCTGLPNNWKHKGGAVSVRVYRA